MNNPGFLLIVSGLVGATALGLAPERAEIALFAAGDEPERITLTSADVRASNEEAAAAHGALVAMWDAEFRRIGERFVAPRLARYRGNVRSACGIIPASNAAYCDRSNTIYFDEVFLAAQAKLTGHALRMDGDMAAVGIIAHEMGHAVTEQLGLRFRSVYGGEAAADCLAGVFARHAERDGSLEAGDMDEAFYAMAAAADPQLGSTGDARLDARRQRMLERNSHGTREQRQQNFRAGYERGSGACLPSL
jgi:predicted metalloprotease